MTESQFIFAVLRDALALFGALCIIAAVCDSVVERWRKYSPRTECGKKKMEPRCALCANFIICKKLLDPNNKED